MDVLKSRAWESAGKGKWGVRGWGEGAGTGVCEGGGTLEDPTILSEHYGCFFSSVISQTKLFLLLAVSGPQSACF